jgi:CRISPR-associated endonuclease Csn1
LEIPYRLGLDLGSNSLGWAVLRLDENGRPDYLLRLGVRIFDNGRHPKTGASLAVDRRLARQARRRRDRMLRRKRRLLAALREFGLFPVEQSASDSMKILQPLALRHRGLSERLELHELGRAIIHLNQRRGFRSSRRTDRGEEAAKEKGKIAVGVQRLRDKLAGAGVETLGSLLYSRLCAGQPTRVRRVGDGANAVYDFYPERSMIEEEFNLLWARQQVHHPETLTEVAREKIKGILLFQRPLRPIRPGRCSLNPTEDRCPMALPSAQRFRIWQEINNLRWRAQGEVHEHALTDVQRRAVFDALDRSRKCSFAAIRRVAGLARDAVINLQGIKRDFLAGNLVAAELSQGKALGDTFHSLAPEEQDALVLQLLDDSLSDDELLERLKSAYGLTHEAARSVLGARIPEGYARVGFTTILKLAPHLEAGMTYDKAVLAAGFSGTLTHGDGSMDELPYYGKVLQRHVAFGKGEGSEEETYGRIANPSVHIALNQLRRLVNALIKRYGKPQQVVIELARDIKLGWRQAREIEAKQAERQRENERLVAELEQLGVAVSGENLLRLRLYREICGTDGLGARCTYTGEQISLEQLFSPEVEIDHILPFSRTLDDSIANKLLVKVRANRYKGNQTPVEAFGHSPADYRWEEILDRASRLPRNRHRRFEEGALGRYGGEDGFLARQLNDTAYMSRVAREYLTFVCRDVWSSTGQLTGKLRAKWGLNRLLSHDDLKNRRDHRHHAIDATLVATIDRALVKRVADASARASAIHSGRLLDNLEHPWPTFLPALENALSRVVISYRPDHGVAAALHNDTAYGIVDDVGLVTPGKMAKAVVRHYVPVTSLAERKPPDIRRAVPDRHIAEAIAAIVEQSGTDRKARMAALDAFSEASNVRRVRWVENRSIIPLARRGSLQVYKGVVGDGNHCYEIFAGQNGRWTGEVVSKFTANGPEFQRFMCSDEYRTRAFSGHPLVMRLIQGDTVRVGVGERELVYRVQRFTDGTIVLAYHVGAGDQERNPLRISGIEAVKRVAPSSLQGLRARRVFVDILGRVFDPGFKDVAPNTGDRRRRAVPVGGQGVPGRSSG